VQRGVLFDEDYRPLFSGHETFPLRYGWLKKAYDAVAVARDERSNKQTFRSEDAIARFGVGKNMVGSIRHWAISCGIITEESSGQLTSTPLGKLLFDADGVDRYLEHPGSLWLLHWNLCSGETPHGLKTTWYWAFNQFTATTFRREDLVDGLMKFAAARAWPRVSRTTVQRDVECFVRTYESRPMGVRGVAEDNLESALAELGLIRGLRGQFQFVRASKRTLPHEVFITALNGFWTVFGDTQSLSFEAIAHEPGSPGRVFLLDEDDLADRLLAMEELTNGIFRWSETAGLRQALRSRPLSQGEIYRLLQQMYERQQIGKAA